MNSMQQVKFENETQCFIRFKVNEDGTLDYNNKSWKLVEPKLRTGWSQGHVFDIGSRIYFEKNGWISTFTLQVDKKKPASSLPIKLGDVNVELSGDDVVAEFGGVVSKNLKQVIADIRAGYLPRIMEEFENFEKIQLSIEVCYAQLKVRKCRDELAEARYELQETQEKLEKYREIGGNFYGKEKKDY